MKATLWLCPLLTMLACVSQQVSSEPFTDTRILQPQDNSLVAPAKRTKPSLSIVNPLDVLRQRIILEMARRQMRENTRQVERNKAILREIGKRSHGDARDEYELRFDRDQLYYQQLPFLQRYDTVPVSRLDIAEYEMEPKENRKPTVVKNSRSNDSPKQINQREQISSNANGDSGAITLAQEQRQLEREQQKQHEGGTVSRSTANAGPQNLRYLFEREIFPSGVSDGQHTDDEYIEANNLLRNDDQQQQDDKLKSDDYRLRYLYGIQDKLFG
ncbi:uncharacterized protein LOC129777414 [Toxorhynchites rutilus septentrionalis]|uniref:uncharacterized protein LOC129777414 n=1 Tax=Toxorhynchites rutilus septentrionalis TaxID=329112 RepID=UPI002478B781|nr:uncharacterized protein LOC129777414 [Toxorhynchites rutilus septentrionalis]XP_055639643.1 uncharacterized protein LOC129777414 [Toxorhynchites rutilus septentrionalis]